MSVKVGELRGFHSKIYGACLLMMCMAGVIVWASDESAAQSKAPSALAVLQSLAEWKSVPPDFVAALAGKLKSRENAMAFAHVCEKSGILRNQIPGILEVAGGDRDYAVGLVATSLGSYAMSLLKQQKFDDARRALILAVTLRPRHVPTWAGLALLGAVTGDCTSATMWAERVLSFRPDASSKDPLDIGQALAMTPEGERLAEAHGQGKVGDWQEILNLMKEIESTCRR